VGFRVEPTHYKLNFADEDLAGLEVTARSLPIRDFLAIQRIAGEADTNPESAEQVLRKLAGVLVSWNLEDETGEAIPPTFEGLESQELPLVLRIFRAWMAAVADVPNRSPGNSNGTATSLEQSIPMAVA